MDKRVAHQFVAHQAEGAFDTRLTGGGEGEKVVRSDADGLCPQRQGFEDLSATGEAAIDQGLDAVTDGTRHLGQLVEGGAGAVKRATGMVGQDDGEAADFGGLDGVLGGITSLRQDLPPQSLTIWATSVQFNCGSRISLK